MQGKNTCNRSRYKAFFFLASVSFFSVKITYQKKKKKICSQISDVCIYENNFSGLYLSRMYVAVGINIFAIRG